MTYHVITTDNQLITFNEKCEKMTRGSSPLPLLEQKEVSMDKKIDLVALLANTTIFTDRENDIVAIIPNDMIKCVFRSDTNLFTELFPEKKENVSNKADSNNIFSDLYNQTFASRVNQNCCCCDDTYPR